MWPGGEAVLKDLRNTRVAALLCVLLALCAATSNAQELTPRAYWPAPHGTKVAVLGYAHTSGEVLFNPSTPLYGVDTQLDTFVLAYLQTFSLFGRTANIVLELPYVEFFLILLGLVAGYLYGRLTRGARATPLKSCLNKRSPSKSSRLPRGPPMIWR